jgi:predicted pyridoxine 5'-phosphate oxidase superfamily flavin-nucleotide-binding protein
MSRHYRATLFTPEVLAAQQAAYGQAQATPPSAGPDALGPEEAAFIAERDSFYLASVNPDGWPYLQHRGGPRGFLHVLGAHTLAFADLRGNRQLLTTGHLAKDDRVSLFLMDYPRRSRLKLLGHATTHALGELDAALAARLAPAGVPAAAIERYVRIRVVGFDWNCPKYITPRYTAEDVQTLVNPLRARIAELEARLAAASLPPASPPAS